MIWVLGITPIAPYWIYSSGRNTGLHISKHIPVADWEVEKYSFPWNRVVGFCFHTRWSQSCASVYDNLLTRGCMTTCITNCRIIQNQQLICAFLPPWRKLPAKTVGGKNNCIGQHRLKIDVCWTVCLPVPSLHQKAAVSHGKMPKTPKHWSKETDLHPHCTSSALQLSRAGSEKTSLSLDVHQLQAKLELCKNSWYLGPGSLLFWLYWSDDGEEGHPVIPGLHRVPSAPDVLSKPRATDLQDRSEAYTWARITAVQMDKQQG